MLNDPSGGYSASFPSKVISGAGLRASTSGLALRLALDYGNLPLLTNAPAAGHVLVQDPVTGENNRLDLSNLPTTVPQDSSVTNRKFAAVPAFTFKGNAASVSAQPQDVALSYLVQAGNPVGDALAGKASLGHRAVEDANYQCLTTDVQVGLTSLTASRIVFLPDVDSFPFGQDLVVADESGACSDALLIKIRPGVGTGDTIGGADIDPALGIGAVALSSPYQSIRFRRGAANLWIRS